MIPAARSHLARILLPGADGKELALPSDTGGDTCRVTMVAPRVRIDVALPTAVPLASLLPTLLWHSGEQLAEEGLAHGGWALQRAGDAPLDTAASVATLGIRDGDILYLRPRQEALPAAVYDDAADAIVTTLRDQARRWRPEHARAAALTAMGVALLAGAAALAGLEAQRLAVAGIAAAAAVLALLGAVAASRAFGDALAGTVLGAGALPFAFLAGLDGTASGAGGLHGSTPPEFLAGAAALLVTAAIAAVAVGDPGSMLAGALAAGLIAVCCSATPWSPPARAGRRSRSASRSRWRPPSPRSPTGWPGCPGRPCPPAPRNCASVASRSTPRPSRRAR